MCLITLFSVAGAKEITIEKLQAGNTISIDGDDTDWPSSVVYQAVDQHKGEVVYRNNTVSLKMTYDDKFLYVSVRVEDATLDTAQSANHWEKDCIDLYFVLNDTISDGTSYSYYSPNYGAWQLRKIYGRVYEHTTMVMGTKIFKWRSLILPEDICKNGNYPGIPWLHLYMADIFLVISFALIVKMPIMMEQDEIVSYFGIQMLMINIL